MMLGMCRQEGRGAGESMAAYSKLYAYSNLYNNDLKGIGNSFAEFCLLDMFERV